MHWLKISIGIRSINVEQIDTMPQAYRITAVAKTLLSADTLVATL